MKEDAIIMCPVDEIGRYSVMPSIMARIMDSIRFMRQKYQNRLTSKTNFEELLET